MGKRTRKDKPNGDDGAKQRRTGGTWHNMEDEFMNAKLEAYYRGSVVPESEWDAFAASARQILPISFRVSTIAGRYKHILNTLENECFGLPKEATQVDLDGEVITVQAPQKLPWYSPFGHAFQLSAGKNALRKIKAYQEFRKFLIRENLQGNLTRQETVSMIPPQLLGVKPHHIVLDMCAAPGSKTAQLLEDLHSEGFGKIPSGIVIANDANPDRAYMLVHQLKRLGSPSFLVTTHEGQFFPNLYIPRQSKLASEDLAYENNAHNSKLSKMENYNTSTELPVITDEIKTEKPAPLLFDRILCDVPCSGDGTIRKCPVIWKKWGVAEGMGLHPLQLSIAWRAAQMLKVGGRMVYSTCSLNPMENEAVVAELIRKSGGALRIVDVSNELPGLIREPGMHSWNVVTKAEYQGKNEEDLKTFQDSLIAAGYQVPESGYIPRAKLTIVNSLETMQALSNQERMKLKSSFFPPHLLSEFKEKAAAKWESNIANDCAEKNLKDDIFRSDSFVYENLISAEDMHLERCVRILPHKQDTGGFFITLLEKVAVLPSWTKTGEVTAPVAPVEEVVAEEEPIVDDQAIVQLDKKSNDSKPNNNKKDKSQRKFWNDAPFIGVTDEVCDSVVKQFQLKVDDVLNKRNMFCRSQVEEGNSKKVYFLSDSVGELVNTPHNFRLKVVQSGLRIFEVAHNAKDKATRYKDADHTVGNAFRVCQDGLAFVLPYLGKQVLRVGREDFRVLLECPNGALHPQLSEQLQKQLAYIPDFDAQYTGVDEKASVINGIVDNSKIELGSFVVRVIGDDVPDVSLGDQVVCATWRTPVSVNLMIDTNERESLLAHFSNKTDEQLADDE